MSIYHTPELFGFTLVGKILWEDTDEHYQVTAVFAERFGDGYAWGTDEGRNSQTSHPFTGWELCDLDTGTALDFAAALSRLTDYLIVRGHTDRVATSTPAILSTCGHMHIEPPAPLVALSAS